MTQCCEASCSHEEQQELTCQRIAHHPQNSSSSPPMCHRTNSPPQHHHHPNSRLHKNSSSKKDKSSYLRILTNCALRTLKHCSSCLFSRTFRRSSCSVMDPLLLVLLASTLFFRLAEGCSTRSTPKPRPPSPTTRPNITFQTYPCPETYAKWYCLNGATCFTVKIGESILYNCECADGYVGQRCEFKDLDGSYLPSRESILIERASIAGGVTLAVIVTVVGSIAAYVYVRRRRKQTAPCPLSAAELQRKPFCSVRLAPLPPEQHITLTSHLQYGYTPTAL